MVLLKRFVSCVVFFFFQAEDGIRDSSVTGVQTCALPICGGISATATAEGNPSISGWLSGPPAGSVAKDVLIGGPCAKYPASFSCPSAASGVGFVSYNSGNGGDYRLCTGAGAPSASCAGASTYAAAQSNACQAHSNCG